MEVPMGLMVTARNARQLAADIWSFEMPPNQVRFFGECRKAEGTRSVLLIANPQFDAKSGGLAFDSEEVVPLNVGSTSSAVALSAGIDRNRSVATGGPEEIFQSGDQEFLAETNQLPLELRDAAKKLLNAIRSKFPGDLVPAQHGRFINSPDNFWTVKVQPKVGNLSITVRGEPERFGKSTLEIKNDRHGYSRFWLRTAKDGTEAMRIIFAARMRG
jgi:hypothetical protein